MTEPRIIESALICLGCPECWERQRLAKAAQWRADEANRAARNRDKWERVSNARRDGKAGAK